MRQIFLIFVLLFSCFTLAAQDSNPDTIYLKDGSVVKGTIVEQTSGGSLKVITSEGVFKTYAFDAIDRMVKGVRTSSTTTPPNSAAKQSILDAMKKTSDKGFKSIINFGYGFGSNSIFDLEDRFHCKYIGVYQFNPRIMLGAGMGMNFYYDIEEISLPVFAHFRWTWLKTKVSPFLSTSLGYNIPTSDGYFDGLFWDYDMGVVFPIKNNRKMSVSLGVEVNEMLSDSYSYGYSSYYHDYDDSDFGNAINLKVAIIF